MPAKILIVEDMQDMALALRMPLEATGYEVFHALSGQEGLEMVKQVKPDLIILDVMMETTTAGFQVSLQLRQKNRGEGGSPWQEEGQVKVAVRMRLSGDL